MQKINFISFLEPIDVTLTKGFIVLKAKPSLNK